jgi:hypothetical protein
MTSRQKFYLGVSPAILGLLLFAFVPLDKLLALRGIAWVFPAVLIAMAIIGAFVDFEGRERVIALYLIPPSAALSIGLIVYFKSLGVTLFAGIAPIFVLFVFRLISGSNQRKEPLKWW